MSERIRVMHLNAPLTIAGAEKVILTYLEQADRQSYDVSVASFINPARCPDNPFPAAVESLGVRFLPIPINRSIDFRDIGKLISVIREHRVQILHTHGYRADLIGFIAARCCRVKLVSTVHGWMPLSGKLRLYETLDRWVLGRFDRVIAVSRPLAESLGSLWKRKDAVTLITNAVSVKDLVVSDVERRKLRTAIRHECGFQGVDYVIGIIGRLSSEKGVAHFLDGFSQLVGKHPHLKALIVGDGPERSLLTEQAKTLGIIDYVTFTGFRQDVNAIFQAIDVLVLPSLTEGIPIVVLEAFVQRVPVIASQVGGLPEIIEDGVNGLLVPPAEPERIAQALERLMTDALLLERLADSAHQLALERFDPHQWARRIEAVYSGLVSRK